MDREIARGGAARVFLARDRDNKTVAVKVLRPELAVSVTAERFLREIQLLSSFDHPNIANLIDSGDSDFVIYYVMPFVQGPTLRDHLDRVRTATTNDTLHIAHDLCDALAYAHGRDVIHRDVKPENIVLSTDGPVLVDFGIARAIAESGTHKLTRSGFSVGTSSYMSPEQVTGADDIDGRSDIYSLGCVLFECLTGRPPFTSKHEELVLRMHLEKDAPAVRKIRKDVPKPIAEIVNTALQTNRDKRWQSAEDMRQAISRA